MLIGEESQYNNLSRQEVCEKIGLDADEVFDFALQCFKEHIGEYLEEVMTGEATKYQVTICSVVDTYINGVLTGIRIGKKEMLQNDN